MALLRLKDGQGLVFRDIDKLELDVRVILGIDTFFGTNFLKVYVLLRLIFRFNKWGVQAFVDALVLGLNIHILCAEPEKLEEQLVIHWCVNNDVVRWVVPREATKVLIYSKNLPFS